MGSNQNRTVVYLRVSKATGQSTANQRPEIEALAAARGLKIVRTYEDHESAARARPAYDALMRDARRHGFDTVLVWALDRAHRTMVGAIDMVLQLDRLGIRVVSAREGWLDLDSPVRPLLVAIFGWVAEQERRRLIERTRAGLVKARASGKRLGRPPAQFDAARAKAMLTSGQSMRATARALGGVSAKTIARHLREAGRGEKGPPGERRNPPNPRGRGGLDSGGEQSNDSSPVGGGIHERHVA